jgi:hypothetical protein
VSFTDSIKRFIRDKQLQSELENVQRNRSTVNLKQARRIGIVYDASDEQNYKKIADLVRYLQAQGKLVKALGHVSYNILPHYCHNMLSFDYFLKKEINWWGKPANQRVRDFVAEDYDILIDLNIDNLPSLIYVSAISRAKFKVGLFNEQNKKYFDFMIQLEEPNLNEYIRQIVHYLGVLNQESGN